MIIRDRRLFMRAAVDGSDNVDTGGLPAELVGKTPAEIAAYYADRESNILSNARRMVAEAREGSGTPPPPENPPNNPPPPRTSDTVTREEFNQVTESARAGLIQMAQMTASTGKADWNRLLPEIRKIVEALPASQQINSDIWTEAYYNVRGRMTDTLVSEARNSALGLEPVSPPPPVAAPPRVWTEAERKVIDGCGVTPEMYADAEKKLADNFQPFTTDNRRGRV